MIDQPQISIVTVNYHQPTVTCELLKSIALLSYPNLEVIVVDNGQKTDNTTIYKSYYPYVTVVTSEANLGFAGGNNLGIEKASGEFIFLLNNDTEISDGTIESMLKAFTDDTVGAVNPIIRYYDEPDRVQFSGFTAIDPVTGRNDKLTDVPDDYRESVYFHGAAVMIRKSAIDKMGPMPERYFLYYEELDWSVRLSESGYKTVVDPYSIILHKESVSTGKMSPLKTYYQSRNRLFFMFKNNHFLSFCLFASYYLFLVTPVKLFKLLIAQNWALLVAHAKSIPDFFRLVIHPNRVIQF
ncbi:glycosyltransferase family 2 protein [Reichenbachiella versicolor]|uniref:glycosyltransferase family 2 protein n=1 Tax=Reichenbachiella versicolor TaxID=1821036 RepID=UPI000D6E0DE6|nr:glycosyltransferase family 2 protein [Reichenbachiella versicolor]